jgi:NADPH:quinone reductase-like Zn-dependent oxidoreductase
MTTHAAIIAPGQGQPLTLSQVPTSDVGPGQIQVQVDWVASGPLDVYMVDGGIMADYPIRVGDAAAGTVVKIGEGVTRFQCGDRVFGFLFHGEEEKAHQQFIIASDHLFGKARPLHVLSLAAFCATLIYNPSIRSLITWILARQLPSQPIFARRTLVFAMF